VEDQHNRKIYKHIQPSKEGPKPIFTILRDPGAVHGPWNLDPIGVAKKNTDKHLILILV
jgi:hypothetical protein